MQFDLSNSINVESALLSAMTSLPEEVIPAVIATGVGVDGWVDEHNRNIAAKIFDQIKEHNEFDESILMDDLSGDSFEHYLRITGACESPTGWNRWLDRLLENYKERRCAAAIKSACVLTNEGSDKAFAHLENERREALEIRDSTLRSDELKEIIKAQEDIEMQIHGKTPESRCQFPLKIMDNTFRPPQVHEMITCAARTGVGKTVFACQLTGENMKVGRRGAYISVEMGFDELSKRIAGQMAEVNLWQLVREMKFKQESLKKYVSKIKTTFEHGKFCPIRTTHLETAELRLNRFADTYGQIDYIIVDYVQAMRSDMGKRSDRRDVEIGRISTRLKEWTEPKNFGCTVFAMAQLNRDVARDGIEPQLHHLKECGRLEEDSDRVIMIHCPKNNHLDQPQDDLEEKEYVMFQRKFRNGPKNKVHCRFKSQWAKLM